MLTDPIADMLTRIRNANRAMQDTVSMPTSRMKEEIARLLTDEGYELSGAPWESYLDDPTVAEPRTEVFMPCRRLRPAGEPQPEDGLSL